MDFVKEFFSSEENINEIFLLIVGLILGILSNIILKILKIFFIYLYNRFTTFLSYLKKKVDLFKKKRNYQKTIKNIEKQKIEIPPYFLLEKSPENNPELRKIFQMIDEGIIEEPIQSKMSRHFKENPIDLEKLMKPIKTNIQIPNNNNFIFKNDE